MDESIDFVNSCGQDKVNPDGYLLGCVVELGTKKFKNFYGGSSGETWATWLVKASFNS